MCQAAGGLQGREGESLKPLPHTKNITKGVSHSLFDPAWPAGPARSLSLGGRDKNPICHRSAPSKWQSGNLSPVASLLHGGEGGAGPGLRSGLDLHPKAPGHPQPPLPPAPPPPLLKKSIGGR